MSGDPRPPRRRREPFDAATVRRILERTLKGSCKMPRPAEIATLAAALNLIGRAYRFATQTANESKLEADKVRAALTFLNRFFARRVRAAKAEAARGDMRGLEIMESERTRRAKFDAFLRGMRTPDFELDMDAGALMPEIEGWRDVAEPIAGAFKAAMARSNGDRRFGLSNDGPLARFTAAVIPKVTGERPSVLNVGQHLKRRARERRTAETGTNA